MKPPIVVLLTATLLAACAPAGDESEEVAELEERIAELEAELAEARDEAQAAIDEELGDEEEDEPVEEDESEADGEEGSRGNPIPPGESARVGDWEIAVVDVTPNATEQIMAHNEFNDPPAEGRQFLMATLEATYVGEESGDFWIDVAAGVVGEGNVTYTTFEDTCGSIPDSIDESGEAFEGGQISGNTCWSVESEEVDSLVMFIEDSMAFDRSGRVWFALGL